MRFPYDTSYRDSRKLLRYGSDWLAYGALLVSGLLLSVTRPVVLPLALAVGVHWLARRRGRSREPFPRSDQVKVRVSKSAIATVEDRGTNA